MASQATEPTERDLQAPIAERDDEAYQALSNEAGRRVFTVMQNLIEVRSRVSKGVLEGLEVTAILMGAITGIATIVARSSLKIENPDEDAPPPEILILNDLGNQFLHTIEQLRKTDPVARMMNATAEAGEGKPS